MKKVIVLFLCLFLVGPLLSQEKDEEEKDMFEGLENVTPLNEKESIDLMIKRLMLLYEYQNSIEYYQDYLDKLEEQNDRLEDLVWELRYLQSDLMFALDPMQIQMGIEMALSDYYYMNWHYNFMGDELNIDPFLLFLIDKELR